MPLPPAVLRERIEELAPWYQNIRLAEGISTKDLGGTRDTFPHDDIPRPLWELILRDLGDVRGSTVLDIGCNAGYMSFECKKLGAAEVLGVDVDLGASTSFIEQARFCAVALDLDVEFRKLSFLDLTPEQPFDLVLFCGILYHLENWADALDKLLELVAPVSGRVVLETAIEPVTCTVYGDKAYRGDAQTFFVPSLEVLLALLRERGFRLEIARDLTTRALLFLSLPESRSRPRRQHRGIFRRARR